MAVLVLQFNADVDARHFFANTTAAHMAAENSHVDALRTLCDLGAKMDAATALGGTALHAAVQKDRAAAVSALLGYEPCRKTRRLE